MSPNSGYLAYTATLHGPTEALLIQYLRKLPNVDTSLFCEADRFLRPASTWTVPNLLNNAHLPLTQDCLPPLINSTTGHYY